MRESTRASAALPWAAPTPDLSWDWIANVPSWTEDALCAQTDPEIFFPERGGSTRKAKKVCFECVARADCLEWALNNDERHGVLGGKSERERRKIKRSTRDLSEVLAAAATEATA